MFKPVEYMAAMLLMVGAISALGSLLLATFCESLSFSLDEVNSGPHQAVVVANVPLVGFFYVYSGETPGGNSGELFISLLVL